MSTVSLTPDLDLLPAREVRAGRRRTVSCSLEQTVVQNKRLVSVGVEKKSSSCADNLTSYSSLVEEDPVERQERGLFWKPAAPPLAEPNAPLLANTPVFVTIHGYSPAAAARQTRLADGGRKRGVVSPQTQRLDHGKLV